MSQGLGLGLYIERGDSASTSSAAAYSRFMKALALRSVTAGYDTFFQDKVVQVVQRAGYMLHYFLRRLR